MIKGQNMNSTYTREVNNNFSAPLEISEDIIICPYCHRGISHFAIKYAGGKNTASPRLWCKACQKKFSIRYKSINWLVHFGRLYADNFIKPNEINSIRARYNDFMLPESIRLFDSNLRSQKKTETSANMAIEKAFSLTLRTIINKAIKRLRKRDIDNWSIIINKYSGEKCYELDLKFLKAENKGIIFLSKRDKNNPLIRCAYCQGTHIIKNSYTNVGRRRFKCVNCDRSFILRGMNLFNYHYVKKQILILYLRSFSISKEHISELNSMCSKMAIHFMQESNMTKISKKLRTEFTVSELFRTHEIEMFVTKYSGEYKIVPSKPSEVFKKMTLPSNVLLLPRPEEYVKVLNTVRISKAIEIDLRDYMETDGH